MKNKKVMEMDFQNWPLPDEYLNELGRIAALWASLEAFLNICIGKLAGFNDLADMKPFILVNHSSFPQKLDIMGALCEQLVVKYKSLDNYKSVISKLSTAQKLRNKYLHNSFAFDPEVNAFTMGEGKARGTLKTSVIKIELEDIRKAAMQIHIAQIDLHNLVVNKKLLPKWERKDQKPDNDI